MQDSPPENTTKTVTNFCFFLPKSDFFFASLRIANIGVEFEIIKRTLEQLFLNKNLKDLYLDISRNNIGPEGATALVEVFKHAQSIKALNVADNDIREKGVDFFRKILHDSRKFFFLVRCE